MKKDFYSIADITKETGYTRQMVHHIIKKYNIPVCMFTPRVVLISEKEFFSAINKGVFERKRRRYAYNSSY